MFKLVNGILILACAWLWMIILARPALKYEDTVCDPPTRLIRYPEGWRVPYCKPTGIVWAALDKVAISERGAK